MKKEITKGLNIVRELRECREFTQQKMADLLGVSRITYMKMESGEVELHEVQAKIFCQALGISWSPVELWYASFDKHLSRFRTGNEPPRTYPAHDLVALHEQHHDIESSFTEGHGTECPDCVFISEYIYMYDDPESNKKTVIPKPDYKVHQAVQMYLRERLGGLRYVNENYLITLMYLIECEHIRKYGVPLAGSHYERRLESVHLSLEKPLSIMLPHEMWKHIPARATPILDAYVALARIRTPQELVTMLKQDHAWIGTEYEWNIPYIMYYQHKRNITLEDEYAEVLK